MFYPGLAIDVAIPEIMSSPNAVIEEHQSDDTCHINVLIFADHSAEMGLTLSLAARSSNSWVCSVKEMLIHGRIDCNERPWSGPAHLHSCLES